MKSSLYDVPLMFLSSFLFRVAIAYLGLWLFTASIHFSLSVFGEVAGMDLLSRNVTKAPNILARARFFSNFQRLVFSYKKGSSAVHEQNLEA